MARMQGARKEGRDQKGKLSTSWLHKAKSAVGGAFGGRAVTRYDALSTGHGKGAVTPLCVITRLCERESEASKDA